MKTIKLTKTLPNPKVVKLPPQQTEEDLKQLTPQGEKQYNGVGGSEKVAD